MALRALGFRCVVRQLGIEDLLGACSGSLSELRARARNHPNPGGRPKDQALNPKLEGFVVVNP